MFDFFMCAGLHRGGVGGRSQVQSLSLSELEALGEALLDFSALSDLLGWLGDR
jgi:hypothetical protein